MKRLLLKILALIAIVITMAGCSDDILSDDVGTVATKSSVLDHESLSKIGINLMESFQVGVLRTDAPVYPDYYCGAYIDDENNFVILVQEDAELYKDNFVKRTKSSDILTKTAIYSMNELLATIDYLNEFAFDETNESTLANLGLNKFGLNSAENKVFVGLENCNETAIEQFKSIVMDSPMLVFMESTGDIVAEEDVYCGAPITTSAGRSGSIGYRARSGSQNGMVTAGHVVRGYGETVYALDWRGTSYAIGTCIRTQMMGSVDGAFISFNSFATPSNYTYKLMTRLNAYAEYPFQGANVTKEGKVAATRGSIKATNMTKTISFPSGGSALLSGLAECDYESGSGDSGGVVYSGNNNVFGIHTGAGSGNAYFVPAVTINSTFNLTMY